MKIEFNFNVDTNITVLDDYTVALEQDWNNEDIMSITFNVTRCDKFKDIMANLDPVLTFLQKERSFIKDQQKLIYKIDEVLKDGFNHQDIVISLFGDIYDIRDYLQDNTELLDYPVQIVVNDNNALNNARLYTKILGDYPNIYIYANNNTEPVTIKDYQKTIEYIDKLVDNIKGHNFSPLEELMYAYDIVRNRVYTEEDKKQNYRFSRDITKVVLGDKIVCVGFAALFNEIISGLGFKCDKYYMDSTTLTVGHAISSVLVNDEKYGLNGIYFFDPTWDSRKSNNDHKYLLKYKHFATDSDKMSSNHPNYDIHPIRFFTKKNLKEIIDTLESQGPHALSDIQVATINYFACLVNGKNLISHAMRIEPEKLKSMPPILQNAAVLDVNKAIDMIECLYKAAHSPIPYRVYKEALYEVRKHEFYEYPEEFPYDISTFNQTIDNSGWTLTTKEARLLSAIFDIDENDITDEIANEDLAHEIALVRIARSLKKYTEQTKRVK